MTTPQYNSASPLAHEPEGISIRWMAGIGLGLLVVVVIVACGVAFAFQKLAPSSSQGSLGEQAKRQLLVPGVQANQAYDREMIAEQERVHLSHYHWQDTDRRFARIPIERAMEIMSQRKLQTNWPVSDGTRPEPITANPSDEEQP